MDDYSIDLAKYRLEKAENCLKAAKIDFENELYPDSVNRSYYAIFHSARALMALDGEDRKKHSGVISYFQRHYIKTRIFESTLSQIIVDAFMIRQNSDYEDFFVVSQKDVVAQIENAKKFYETISRYVENRIAQNEVE